MTKRVKIILTVVLLVTLSVLVGYGVQAGKTPEEMKRSYPASGDQDEDPEVTAETLTRQAEEAIKNGTEKQITLKEEESSASEPGVEINGKRVTINTPGIYAVSGTVTEGQLSVDCDGTVVLILQNVTITNAEEPAIYIKNAAHTLIYLPEGSQNYLESGTEHDITADDENEDAEEASGASLYAKDDLSISGSGELTVNGYVNNGIATTDRLTVLSGGLQITAVNHGLKGKDAVTVQDGTINIKCGNDGIKTEQDLLIAGGNMTIEAGISGINKASEGKGINDTDIPFDRGALNGPQGSEMPNGPQGGMMPGRWQDGEMPGGPQNGEMPGGPQSGEMPGGQQNGEMPGGPQSGEMPGGHQNGEMPDGGFRKGFSGWGMNDSSINESSVSSDALYAGGNVMVTGGVLCLSASHDGIHAEDALEINDGTITVTVSYEGLEARRIYVNGGVIDVTASDDGLNAGGGVDEDGTLPLLLISGGYLVVNASGDGLDSNGDLIVEGGEIIVSGPENSGNGALDAGTENGGKLLVNGGNIIAIGASGMAETFGNESEQCSFIKNYSETIEAGTEIRISDEEGNVLMSIESAKSFSSIVFSDPGLILGKTYTITVGERSDTITMDSISNGSSSDFGSFGKGFNRGKR